MPDEDIGQRVRNTLREMTATTPRPGASLSVAAPDSAPRRPEKRFRYKCAHCDKAFQTRRRANRICASCRAKGASQVEEQEEEGVSYLKIKGKFFAIREIQGADYDIDQELRTYYKERHDRHMKELNDPIVRDLTDDLSRQLTHIERFRQRTTGTVIVPEQLLGKPITYKNESFRRLRPILYSPNVYVGYTNNFREQCDFVVPGNYTPRHGLIEVTVKPRFAIPLIVSIETTRRDPKLFVEGSFRTFHTYDRDADICIGEHSAAQYWRAPNFNDLMNMVNLTSLTRRTVTFRSENRVAPSFNYSLRELVNSDTVTNITVRKEGTWTT